MQPSKDWHGLKWIDSVLRISRTSMEPCTFHIQIDPLQQRSKEEKPIPVAQEDLHHCLAVWNCSWWRRLEGSLHLSRLGVWCIGHLDKGRMQYQWRRCGDDRRCHFAAIFTDMPSTQDPDPQLNFIPRWTEPDNPEVGSTVYDAVYLLHIDYTISP